MRKFFLALAATLAFAPLAAHSDGPVLQESSFWAQEVNAGSLPHVQDRIPSEPLVVDLEAKGRSFGRQGGTLRTLISRTKDVRQMVVYGYARLVGYQPDYTLAPDILAAVDVEEGRKFTLHLRPGHRWSDGMPFTSDDFRYWWENVANDPDITPSGPPDFMIVDNRLGKVTFPDEHTVVFEWQIPNPNFLPLLAQASPPFIYRPAHYLSQFHKKFADPDALAEKIKAARVKSWAALHNKRDNMYKFDNPALPTLQPWINTSDKDSSRKLFVRNPYFHRIDSRGVQLPYIDVVQMTVVGGGLIAAKANAGEVDLQARGLDFPDVAILKKGEADGGKYRTLLWANGAASQIAIYPNLNFADPVWREVMRDVRFRRALSLGIDRRMINRALYFGLASEGGMSALSQSALYNDDNTHAWSMMNLAHANALLDDMGLTDRTPAGLRKLPDGRPMEFVIETAGERSEEENALAIIADTWRDLGIRLIMRPLDRDILRNRIYAGRTMASVWFGWDNGLPGPSTSPSYLAPTNQEFFAWPMWGQYYQTVGQAGSPPDMQPAKRLMLLANDWNHTDDPQVREDIWKRMLAIHAEQQFAIGVLAEAPQPVVVSNDLMNVPEHGIWAFDPGAHFGIHRIDEFYFQDPHVQVSR
ncbi:MULTISPECIES: ABC transporter substrate-binding protein [Sulfitobacter]|jgi:peptide/nickel transport system substrate-binding protein|nr:MULTISPECIES: ABC transporter substrate-binding protein [Sulfitobacter]MAN08698.1 peptide ABC transporter substrate-binding protein [Roseobacter sp.]HBU55586.1 peptide ABC transporter substrate-binding protein [Sulfitobacter sp.]MAN09945.1 peptide ABC transporter substrate-binding protein [Roseobacter sp.]MAX75595.1 peptide ABC transporter substrate-binding protein [Roseobacter sp.]GLO77545.1 peptide ABC transporter substrate-binding protein [Sulfitobacter pontiacus]|tara:strand:- start:10187 stop:12112 length:1926 start_codon:yes stop_codon:yes gene_type:complete